eukprot:TRINITY_DN9217_c0_g1_i2.p1 TRINITY_DN9217_c0_g1~~TRINITY_DN9217_c0_g1_i2.p1  ORF type:complete len:101 (-),score=21.06 TRINITY_DN9217_c0_g1_i2:85-387(-)
MCIRDSHPLWWRVGVRMASDCGIGIRSCGCGYACYSVLVSRDVVPHRFRLKRLMSLTQHEQGQKLSLIHISEPTRLLSISYAVFCLKKKKKIKNTSELLL